jgi:hypothetical protein
MRMFFKLVMEGGHVGAGKSHEMVRYLKGDDIFSVLANAHRIPRLKKKDTSVASSLSRRFPGIDNNKEGLQQNADGSYDIYFGPKPPTGKESNWLQTVPGKGWNVILRLYGPLQPCFDPAVRRDVEFSSPNISGCWRGSIGPGVRVRSNR